MDFKYLCTLCFSCFLCCVPRRDSSLKQVSCTLRVKWSIYPLSSVAQSRTTLCDPMDCNTPGFPVHLSQVRLWVSRGLQESPADACVGAGLLLLEALPQCGLRPSNRAGTQSCSQQKMALKVAEHGPAVRTRPRCPRSQSLPLTSFHKPLTLLHQRQTEWKPKSQETSHTDHMDHSLV